MAFVTKRVWAPGESVFLPTGHSVETSAASIGASTLQVKGISVDLAASGFATTTQAAGVDTALKTDLVSAIDTLIGTTYGIDTTGNSVSYNAKVIGVNPTNDLTNQNVNDMYLNDATRTVTVTFSLIINVS